MSKARDDGRTIKVRYGKVLICGASAAGKTNFLNLLMREDFQKEHIITEVAKPQQVSIAMKAQVSKNDNNKEIVFKKMNIDSEIDQLTLHLLKECITPSILEERLADVKGLVQLQKVSESEIQKSCTIPEIMISRKLADNADSEEEILPMNPTENIWDILTFMDTGGQPEFISMLPAVNNFAMITFIVHKMRRGKGSLNEKVVVEKDSKDIQLEYTYNQLIQTLMSYAGSVLFPDKEFLNEYKESASVAHDRKKCTSLISFIGTHSSHVSESDIEEIDSELIKNTDVGNIKPNLNTSYRYLVPVDNKTQAVNADANNSKTVKPDTNNRTLTDPTIIRDCIYKQLEKQDIYSIPIQWLLLELHIRKLCIDKKCTFITYDEIAKMSRDKNLGEDEFIKDGLKFHHLFGVLLYFEMEGMPELIITDHQWLFDKLTAIVNQYNKKINPKLNFGTNLELETYESKGIFKETLLDGLNISKDFENSEININPIKYFLKLLQHLRIIAPLNKDHTEYFMPSLLDSYDLSKIQEKISETSKFVIEGNEEDSEPLLIQFKSLDNNNLFPRGILGFLVVQLLNSTKWTLRRQAYNNFVSFKEEDTARIITLIDRIHCLEVQVTRYEIGFDFVHDGIFITVRDAIIDAFAEVGNKLNVSIKLKYGFWSKNCKESENRHISLLRRHGFCFCIHDEPTILRSPHLVWFKAFKVRLYPCLLRTYIVNH